MTPTPTKALQELRDASFEVRWRDGSYRVSIPNYEGGQVVPLEAALSILQSLASATGGQGESIDTDDEVEALARKCGWNNRHYMTDADYSEWSRRMRMFVALAHPAARITEEQMRERFEAHPSMRHLQFKRMSRGDYEDGTTHLCWTGFRAAFTESANG